MTAVQALIFSGLLATFIAGTFARAAYTFTFLIQPGGAKKFPPPGIAWYGLGVAPYKKYFSAKTASIFTLMDSFGLLSILGLLLYHLALNS